MGIAREAKNAGETVQVLISGISDVHSGLTPGEIYFGDSAGDLSTTKSLWRAGMAKSATSILLDSEFFGGVVFANNFRITEASSYEGLIFKNQLSQDILSITEAGDLNVAGYLQLDTVSSAPAAADCDEASEAGRMKVDPSSELLYICVTSME